MTRNLQADLITLRTVLDLAEKRDFVGAAALAEQTLAEGFEHPMLLNIVATRLEQQDKYEEALNLLERAVAIAPNDTGARHALGLCLQRLDRPAEALVHIDELLRQQPTLSFAHASKGNALMALGSLGLAQRSHQRALELEPRNFPATVAFASIATHRGQHAQARHWAQRALEILPGYPEALLSLAAADKADDNLDSAEKLLRKLIIDSRSGPLDRARAAGLLGDVLDDRGRFDEAFSTYSACNEALRQIHRRFASSDVIGYTRAVTAAIEKIDSSQWKVPPEAPHTIAAGHVFLLGFPRTGTTLVEVVLEGNPHVISLEEHELLADAVVNFMREPLNFEPLARADVSDVEALREAYWRRVHAAGIDVAGKIFIDKHPLNTLKLPLIAKLFPQAKILFAVRDPRDVILSCFRRRFQMNPSMYEFLTVSSAAAFYAAAMELAYAAKHKLTLEWHEIRYESVIGDFEPQMRDICEYLGLEWIPSMGDFASRVQAREHATPSAAQLSQGLVTSATAQWRHYGSQLAPALPALKPWLERFGY